MWPLVLLSVLCIGNAVAVYALWRKKQHLEALQAKQEKQIEQQNNTLKNLSRRLETYLAGSIRMGEELHELQKDLGPLPDKILRMEQRDPSSLSFTQAARLVGLGASAEDLKQSCGLSQSEAELLQRMHSKQNSQ
ncbi:DUF2802 domain-containing protein [Pseudomonas sp. C27(2019)]|uniref:DUF2802 domain-containing protein n=1 Tax=Pseudomonas sp. C27(2019) TaxID=2604941 RepID=UPI001247658C|nr:DUF2802 domain-containing protein [Pseudomonas sp. C27(2019)]QEY59116.1 DUF2802 domain-containing protein [Pseudomonas sp. C27(2019)]